MSLDTAGAVGIRWPGWVLGASVLVLLVAVDPSTGQPHANAPLPIPQFSIDRASPTEGPSAPASAILGKPGPTTLFSGVGLGLLSAEDELDDFCYGRSDALQSAPMFLFLFGVDRGSVGAAPPDAALAATGRIFNVTDQAARNQAAADLFLTLDAFTLEGCASRKQQRTRSNNNTLVVNQGDTGGVDKDLSPEKAPVQLVPVTQALDEGDAAAYPPGGAKSRNPAVFFTVNRSSPSLLFMPGTPGQQSGADVFRDANPEWPGTEELFASAIDLGLMSTPSGDDIDALVVFDDGDGVFDPGIDAILFSLTRGSPSLNQGLYSPADIFISRGTGVFMLFAEAQSLGLLFTDNLDCLEIVPTSNPSAAVFDHAVFLVWPGDYDRNGQLDQLDCAAFVGCYSGPGQPYDTNGTAVHQVMVGPGYSFYPNSLIIETGDLVRWVWADGPHNVVSGVDGAPDGVFHSGAPAFPATMFNVTFNKMLLNLHPKGGGQYPYFSEPDWFSGMVGSVAVQPHPCEVFDLDFDEDVDCADWRQFQEVYAQANPAARCLPLSVPDFVDALLGQPNHPAHACLADLNGDQKIDALDVQPFVIAVLGP